MDTDQKFAADIASLLTDRYITQDNKVISGQSVSFALSEMRDYGRKWRNLGSLGNFEDLCIAAGFRIVKGQAITRDGRRFGRTCRVITTK